MIAVAGVGYLWGHWDGAKCQLGIMQGHFQEGMGFEDAIGYEQSIHKGKVPRA